MIFDLIEKIKLRLHNNIVEPFLNYTYQTTIPANKEGKFASKECFPEYIQKGIKFKNIYEHQRLSWELLNNGEHLCIALPTAAGKSLCYIPYALKTAKEGYKVIVISPLKALQLDQYNKMNEFIKDIGLNKTISTSLNNSDTKTSERVYNANITFIGEYSLDHAIKNDEIDWGKLRLIIIDEAHTYISIKGGHLANIIKRIQIKCLTYKNPYLQIVAMSATIANPIHLFEKLTSYTPKLIDTNTARIGKKNIVLTKFPLSIELLFDVFKNKGKTLVFVDNIISTQVLSLKGNEVENSKYAFFNSSLSSDKRREILNNFGDDKHPLSVLISTSALEAGVDVANVNNVIISVPQGGLPQISIQQRLGRCGRGVNDNGELNEGNVLILLPETSPEPKDVWERPLEYGLPSTSEMLRYVHFVRAIYESIDKRAVLLNKPEGITHYPLDVFIEWFFPDDDVTDLVYKKNNYYRLEDFNGQTYPIFISPSAPHKKMLFQPSSNIAVFEDGTNIKLGTIPENIVKSYYSQGGITNFEGKFYEIISVSKQKVILKKSTIDKEIKLNYNFYIVNLYDLNQYNEKPWIFNHVGDFSISKPLLKKINISRTINGNIFNDNHIGHCLVIEGNMLYSAGNGILRAIDNLFMRNGSVAMYKKDGEYIFYEVEELDDAVLNFYTHFSPIIKEALRLTETCKCENGCSDCIGYVRGSMLLRTEINKHETIKWYKTLIHNLTIHNI